MEPLATSTLVHREPKVWAKLLLVRPRLNQFAQPIAQRSPDRGELSDLPYQFVSLGRKSEQLRLDEFVETLQYLCRPWKKLPHIEVAGRRILRHQETENPSSAPLLPRSSSSVTPKEDSRFFCFFKLDFKFRKHCG